MSDLEPAQDAWAPAWPEPGEPVATSAATRVAAGALVRGALRGLGAQAGPHLLVRPPGGPERVVALPPELTLGRGEGAGLAIDDPGASRRHARLRLGEDGEPLIEDLGSKNGLRLNGRRLAPGPTPLRPGDVLVLGATTIRYVDPLSAPPAPAGRGAVVAAKPGSPDADQGRPRSWITRRAPPPWLLLGASALLLGAAALLLAVGR